jgi:hypothetical protein
LKIVRICIGLSDFSAPSIERALIASLDAYKTFLHPGVSCHLVGRNKPDIDLIVNSI